LDNCEHLIDACEGIVDSMLWSMPELRILVTSRIPVESPAASTWRVGGMTMLDPGAGAAARADRPRQGAPWPPRRAAAGGPSVMPEDGGRTSEAALLFIERARRRQAGYVSCRTELMSVEAMCSRMAGLPLAIELAATHAPTLSPSDIEMELDDMPRLLVAARPNGMARHSSLCESVAASYVLLDIDDRRLLRQLCAGDQFCRAHVEPPGAAASRWAVLRQLESLVDQSVVEPVTTPGGSTRFQVIEPSRVSVLRMSTT
jgi:predicted ATPase